MIESPQKADRKQKEKARNPHDSWLFWQGQKDLNPNSHLIIVSLKQHITNNVHRLTAIDNTAKTPQQRIPTALNFFKNHIRTTQKIHQIESKICIAIGHERKLFAIYYLRM